MVAEWLSSWLAEQEVRGSIPRLATWISEIRYLPLPSRDMAERSLKRRKSSKQPTNQLAIDTNYFDIVPFSHRKISHTVTYWNMCQESVFLLFSCFPMDSTGLYWNICICALWQLTFGNIKLLNRKGWACDTSLHVYIIFWQKLYYLFHNVRADIDLLREVFWNLITTALYRWLLCRLRNIAAHRDHFARRLSVRPSVCRVCLPGSHTFLVVTVIYVSQWYKHSSECCHYFCILLSTFISSLIEAKNKKSQNRFQITVYKMERIYTFDNYKLYFTWKLFYLKHFCQYTGHHRILSNSFSKV